MPRFQSKTPSSFSQAVPFCQGFIQVGVQGQGTERRRRRWFGEVPFCPALESYSPLSHEYNARFNGIRLPSIEQVDLTLKVETDLVESGKSLAFLSTGQALRRTLSLERVQHQSTVLRMR
jgi:hypothetical protein